RQHPGRGERDVHAAPPGPALRHRPPMKRAASGLVRPQGWQDSLLRRGHKALSHPPGAEVDLAPRCHRWQQLHRLGLRIGCRARPARQYQAGDGADERAPVEWAWRWQYPSGGRFDASPLRQPRSRWYHAAALQGRGPALSYRWPLAPPLLPEESLLHWYG